MSDTAGVIGTEKDEPTPAATGEEAEGPVSGGAEATGPGAERGDVAEEGQDSGSTGGESAGGATDSGDDANDGTIASRTAEADGDQSDGDQSDGDEADGDGDGDDGDGDGEEAEDDEEGDDLLVREGDIAGDYLERLLDILDYDGDIDLDVEAGRAIVSIEGGDDLDRLVGPRGTALEALQELTRLAVQQETGGRSRLMLDIAGWRAGRRDELRELGRTTAESVRESGERTRLQPMSPFERKIVHDAVATVDGVTSESEGEEPKRRVVVLPE